jgi:hypothetical protein
MRKVAVILGPLVDRHGVEEEVGSGKLEPKSASSESMRANASESFAALARLRSSAS